MAWWDIGGDLTNLAQRAFGSTPEAGYYIAAPAAAAAAPASSGGWWDSLKSFLTPVGEGLQAAGGVAKAVSPLVNLATGAMGIYGGVKGAQQLAEQTKIARESQRTGQGMAEGAAGAAAPLVGYGKEQLALVEAGKLPESIESEIALWIQGAKQRARDFYARIGQGDSDTLRTMEDLIDQRAISMRAAALQDQARLVRGRGLRHRGRHRGAGRGDGDGAGAEHRGIDPTGERGHGGAEWRSGLMRLLILTRDMDFPGQKLPECLRAEDIQFVVPISTNEVLAEDTAAPRAVVERIRGAGLSLAQEYENTAGGWLIDAGTLPGADE